MRIRVGVGVMVLVAGVLCVAVAASAAAQWYRTLSPGGNPTSIEALNLSSDGSVWAVGGLHTASHYDQPTAWRFAKKVWQAQTIPVDLSNRWGYLTAVASAGAEAWAAGYTVNQTTGNPAPLVAHWDGSAWNVVGEQWIAPLGSDGVFRAVVARSASDVWVLGDDNSNGSAITTPLLWHFNGYVWSRQPAMPIRNPACVAAYGLALTGAVETVDGLYISGNCTTSEFRSAGLVERFGSRWTGVLKLASGSAVNGLAADSAGTIWAVGDTIGSDGFATGAAWTGGPTALSLVAIPAPHASTLGSVATNGTRVEMAGEIEDSGPSPLLISGSSGIWKVESVPYDRGLSGVAISAAGKVWVSGPVFGGWFGNTEPDPAVLTRGHG